MTLAEPLVAALPVCPRGPQAEEIVPMPILMNWTLRLAFPTPVHPAAGIAGRIVLAPTDLVLLVPRAGFPTPLAVAVNPAYPMLVAVAAGSRSPLFPNCLLAAVNPAYPMLVVVAGSFAYPMLVVVALAAVNPARPNRLPAAVHSGPRPQAAVSLAYPIHRLVALAAPTDYRAPAPVDPSHLAQPVVPGAANQQAHLAQQRPSWICRRVAAPSL